MHLQTQLIPIVRRLLDVAAIDSLYADRYLERAEHLLGAVLPRHRYAAIREDYESVPRLTRDLRAAAERQDWQRTSALATQVNAVRARVIAAVDKGDFALVQALVHAIVSRGAEQTGRWRIPRPEDGLTRQLADAIPVPDADSLQRLGLTQEVLPAAKELNEYLGCCCADRPTLAESPRTDAHREAETCTCGHHCPPEVGTVLRENLDLLMLHVFVTSGGGRYLPWFGAETMLVETFAESETDARTPLLEMLRMPKRRGLARIAIENALLSQGGHIVRELGLDPTEFVTICIPYDAYLRLAPSYGRGCAERWTHFDGYQVCRDLRLRALVGGDVRFGGPADLCSVGRDYDTERLTARFAVARRQRVAVRAGAGDVPT